MKYVEVLDQRDLELVGLSFNGFIPPEVYDIHAHPYDPTEATFRRAIGRMASDRLPH